MLEEIKNIKGDPREIKNFTVILGGVIILLAGLAAWYGSGVTLFVSEGIIGIGLILCGIFLPNAARPFYKVWMIGAMLLGWFSTRIILLVAFFFVVTPLAIVSKLAGKRFLNAAWDKEASTYWERRPRHDAAKEHYEQQF